MRSFNNPCDILTVMDVLKQIVHVDIETGLSNTRLGDIMTATGSDRIYIQERYNMLLGPKPALLIEAGPQKSLLAAGEGRDGQMIIRLRYIDTWDNQPETIDAIKRNNMIDLMRIAANLENNDALTFQGTNHAMSIPEMILSGYEESIDDAIIPGMSFVIHDLELMIQVLPYRV